MSVTIAEARSGVQGQLSMSAPMGLRWQRQPADALTRKKPLLILCFNFRAAWNETYLLTRSITLLKQSLCRRDVPKNPSFFPSDLTLHLPHISVTPRSRLNTSPHAANPCSVEVTICQVELFLWVHSSRIGLAVREGFTTRAITETYREHQRTTSGLPQRRPHIP